MKAIILTKEQADRVRGRHGKYSAVYPIELNDGNFGLPPDVLLDHDLADIHEFLLALPVRDAEVIIHDWPDG